MLRSSLENLSIDNTFLRPQLTSYLIVHFIHFHSKAMAVADSTSSHFPLRVMQEEYLSYLDPRVLRSNTAEMLPLLPSLNIRPILLSYNIHQLLQLYQINCSSSTNSLCCSITKIFRFLFNLSLLAFATAAGDDDFNAPENYQYIPTPYSTSYS